MSDISANTEGDVTPDVASTETPTTVDNLPEFDPSEYEGATEDVVESDGDEGETSEAKPSFDWTAHQDDLVTISVDGEDIQVSVAEAMKGYSRQADYTRKTQELAKQREEVATAAALKQALDVDPKRTLAALKALYGDDEAEAIVAEVDDLDANDPLAARVRKFESYMEQQERVAQQNSLIAEAKGAIGTVGLTDVDEAGLLAYATENMIGRLDVAARLMKADQAPSPDVRKAEVVAEKRRAAVVEGGSGRASGSTAMPPATNLADAFAQAKKQLGLA